MVFSLPSHIHFSPLGELDLKKMKETMVAELENRTTSSEGTSTDPCSLAFPQHHMSTLHPHGGHRANSPRALLAGGKRVPSPGATQRHLEEDVVFGERAKLCDCIKVNTIYLHLLSYPRTKGHHCSAQPPSPAAMERRQGLRLSSVRPFVPDY